MDQTELKYEKEQLDRMRSGDAVKVPPMQVRVELDATDVEELMLGAPTPEGVWVRTKMTARGDGSPSGFPLLEISGEAEAVRRFVQMNWGEQMIEDLDDGEEWEAVTS